jgi:hypothetical protein
VAEDRGIWLLCVPICVPRSHTHKLLQYQENDDFIGDFSMRGDYPLGSTNFPQESAIIPCPLSAFSPARPGFDVLARRTVLARAR